MKTKKIISILLSLVMLLSCLAGLNITAYAATLSSSGSCGENVTYTFNSSTGELVISGTGDMTNYEYRSSPFYNQSRIKSVVINSGVTSIGYYAFYDCYSLTSVTIPNSVTSIGRSAFSECSGLTSITIPDSVTSIGNYAFENCSGLTSVTIGDNVTSIGYSAFNGCRGLTNITIPDSVTSIGSGAFSHCTGLTSVTIPNSVTSVGSSAFYNCTGLTSIVVDENNEYYDSRDNCNAIIETSSSTLIQGCNNTVIPDSITSIGSSAFYGCTGLTSVTITNSVTSIGSGAFYGCSGLTSVTIPNSVTSIGSSAFCFCRGLTSVTIGDNVTSIGYSAFYECSGLTSVTIPNSVTSIGDYAFYNCTGLTSVTIPNSVTSIERSTFYGCTGLTSVTIPNSVTSIGNYAFDGCTSIKELTMPASAEISNSKYTFYNCSNIKKVILTKGTGTMQNYSYSTSDSSTYYRYTPWYISRSNTKEIIIEDGVANIGNNAFYDCSGLTNVTIPNSVTSIGSYAFYECSNLNTVSYNATRAKWQNVTVGNYNDQLKQNGIICTDGTFCYTHSFTDYIYNNDAICTVDGTETAKCDRCEATDTRTIADSKLGHDYIEEITQPTHLVDGFIVYTCSRNDDTYTTYPDDLKAIGHIAGESVEENRIEPTCTEDGSYDEVVYCTVCEEELERHNITLLKKNHYFNNYISDNNATCVNDGTKTAKCIRCDATDTITDEGTALGHIKATDNYVAPTCTTSGLTEGSHCSRCNETLVTQETIPANGHNWSGWSVTNAPNGCKDGLSIRICNTCNEIEKLVVPTVGTHNFGANNQSCSICGTANPNYVPPVESKPADTTPAPIDTTLVVKAIQFGSENLTPNATGEYVSKKAKKPALSKVTAGKKSFTATWKTVKGVTGYQVQYATDSKFKKGKKSVTVKKAKTVKTTVKKLSAKKKYYVRIRTYKTVNGVKVYSGWSKTKTVKVK